VIRDLVRAADARFTGGRVRQWWNRNAILGGGWGEFLDRIDDVAPGSVVVDLGAGEATLRSRVRHARYIAVDRGIGHAGWDYSALDVVADASQVPLRARSVDLVVCKQVLEHVPEPIALLREVARILAPGGTLLLSTNQQWPQHQQPYDFFRFTSFGLRYCLEQAGLETVELRSMGGVFSVALFGFSQAMSPEVWSSTPRGRRIAGIVLRPLGLLLRLLMPLVSALDRRDRSRDNTLGWYVVARALRGAGD
jgi:SAM-dependent methyltransferase